MSISELKKKARECELKGDYKKALQIYQKILKENPEDPEVLFSMGQILIRFKQDKKAGEFLLKAFNIFEKKGIYNNKIIALLRKLIQIYPEKKELYKKLAEAYYHIDMPGEAGKTLEAYIEYLFKNGEYEKGFENYEVLLSWQPENFALKERVADLYLTFKKKDKAIELYADLLSYYAKRNKKKEELIRNKLISLGVSEEEIENFMKSDHEEEKKDSVFVTLDQLLAGDRPVRKRSNLSEVSRKIEEDIPVEEVQREVEEEFKDEIEETAEDVKEKTADVTQSQADTAIEEEITEEDIKSPVKVKTLAETLLIMGDYTGALDTYYKAFELYLKENSLVEAFNVLKEIASKWPEEIKARKEMVKIAHMLKNKELLVDSIISLAECLYKRGAKDDALKWFLKALDIEPENKKAIEYISIIDPEKLKKLKKKEKPKKVVKKVKKEKAEVSKKPEQKEKKEVKAEKKEVKPEEKEFFDFKKELLEEIEKESEKEGGIFEEVRETLHKFSKEVDYKGKLELGIAMREMGLYEEAINNLKEAAQGEETRVEALELLGQIFMELNKNNLAIEYFEKALQEKNIDERRRISIEYHLAQCYEKVGDPVNALVYYKRVYEKDPNIKGLKEKIEELESSERRIVDEDRISFL